MNSRNEHTPLVETLQNLRLPQATPDLRARILASARDEWEKPVMLSGWQAMRGHLRALAASIVIAIGGLLINQALVATPPVQQAGMIPETLSEPEPIQKDFVESFLVTSRIQFSHRQISLSVLKGRNETLYVLF